MSTTARKARKRAGVKFERTAKVGTPKSERARPSDYALMMWRHRWHLSGPKFLGF